MTLEGVADRLGWPLGTVKSRLHRALREMRAALDGAAVEDADPGWPLGTSAASPQASLTIVGPKAAALA